ncbi:MAG: hypothetical protein E7288_09255 [Lachnospiraceae bacterium]|nr:hypothetical protein [Lachnospiraceae bacterium]
MATIALNYSPIGQMSGFFEQIKTSISNYQSEILTIQNMSSAVDSTIYNLDDVISEVQTSTTLQDDKTAYIGTLDTQMQTFVDNAVSRDQQAAEEINASKDDFYERYEYLKPDIEKTGWEKFCEWSAENWKFWATVVLVVVAVVIIIVCTAATGGAFLAAIAPYSLVLLGIAKGILIGALVGGVSGAVFGVVGWLAGGCKGSILESVWEGLRDGAFSGALSGAITGGFGAGFELGKLAIALISGGADAATSFLGDILDNVIKNEGNTFLEMLFNATFSFAVGSLTSGFTEFVKGKAGGTNKFFNLFDDTKRSGWNVGDNNAAFRYDYWVKKFARGSADSIQRSMVFKSIVADLITEGRRYIIEIPKGILDMGGDHLNEAIFE